MYILGGLGFIFVMTCLGGGVVVFFKKPGGGLVQRVFLGFAAGVMVAASIWSLLIPSIEQSEAAGQAGWVPAALGLVLGVGFLLLLDRVIPHFHPETNTFEGMGMGSRGAGAGVGGGREASAAGSAADGGRGAGAVARTKRSTLLVLAVTLHNIPEGMAVGLSFALAVQHPENPALLGAALALALGIGIQNFPEGAAISLPLREEGVSRGKAFLMACGSGAVEPVCGLVTVALAVFLAPYMPWLLAFAAGAMLYVVVEELIPEAHLGEHASIGTLGFMVGFLIMMVLDVALG
jgi:ZIP family zinc transporter